jgi:hypothetical protein
VAVEWCRGMYGCGSGMWRLWGCCVAIGLVIWGVVVGRFGLGFVVWEVGVGGSVGLGLAVGVVVNCGLRGGVEGEVCRSRSHFLCSARCFKPCHKRMCVCCVRDHWGSFTSLFVYFGVQLAASFRVPSRELTAPVNRVPAAPVSRVSSFKPAQHKGA